MVAYSTVTSERAPVQAEVGKSSKLLHRGATPKVQISRGYSLAPYSASRKEDT